MDAEALTAAEVAVKLNVEVETVYRMCKAGKWQATKVGRLYRFTPEQYQAIITPPVVAPKPRNQRANIAQLLRSA